jgi:hypothetical protein
VASLTGGIASCLAFKSDLGAAGAPNCRFPAVDAVATGPGEEGCALAPRGDTVEVVLVATGGNGLLGLACPGNGAFCRGELSKLLLFGVAGHEAWPRGLPLSKPAAAAFAGTAEDSMVVDSAVA